MYNVYEINIRGDSSKVDNISHTHIEEESAKISAPTKSITCVIDVILFYVFNVGRKTQNRSCRSLAFPRAEKKPF